MQNLRSIWLSVAVLVPLLHSCMPSDGARKVANADSLPTAGKKVPDISESPPDTFRASAGTGRTEVAANAISWDAPTVADHLHGLGLSTEAVGIVARPMFRVRGQRFRVSGGRATVEAYFYGDANAVALDNDKLDTVQVMPKGGSMQWDMPARLIVDNNMAAVVLTDDTALRKTIESALRSTLPALHGSTRAK